MNSGRDTYKGGGGGNCKGSIAAWGFRVSGLGSGFTLKVQVSLRESPWVSLGSQKPSILRFPNLLGPLG